MDNITTSMQAQVLISALPYIQKYTGKVVVVKYGGNAMINPELKKAVMSDIVLLSLIGIRVVLVHGGGPEITDTLKAMGKESRFVGGLRYTDAETAEVVQMVLAGKVNKDLVSLISQCGGRALGFCGIDAGMIKCRKKEGGTDLGFVGEIVDIDPQPLANAIYNRYIPVVATVGTDENGQVYNINADTAAAEIAASLSAENLLTLTDIRGLMRDVNDPDSMIPHVKLSEIPELIGEGIISGGMIPKIQSVTSALESGVKKAVMIDGRIPHSILIEMFSDEGIGTLFEK